MQSIYLVGFMGSGKTTIGIDLAKRMDFAWYDLDDLLVERHKMEISKIFSIYGEAYFRKEERLVLHQTYNWENTVISTGGGTPCFFDNMEWINRHGYSVFLDPSISILVARLEKGKHKRPLIKDKTEAEMEAFIEGKLTQRRGFYEKAQLHIQGKFESEEAVELILKHIENQ